MKPYVCPKTSSMLQLPMSEAIIAHCSADFIPLRGPVGISATFVSVGFLKVRLKGRFNDACFP
jgi:hypothetical protein